MTEAPRRLFATKLSAPWPCADCEAEIAAEARCFRVIDEAIGFPVVCATCSGRLPNAEGPICAGCFAPIANVGGIWKHEDGSEASVTRLTCACDFGLGPTGRCIRCRGEGFYERVDHLAWPVGRPRGDGE
jgi:hypothetical protein